MPKCFRSRFGGLYLFALVFLSVSLLLRCALLASCFSGIDKGIVPLAKVFLIGLFFDVATFLCMVSPIVAYLVLCPQRLFAWKPMRHVAVAVYAVAVYVLLFDVASEWFFWVEFGCRYNFVAVDYLVYTREVVGNIWESYPVVWILLAIAAVTTVVVLATRKVLTAATDSRQSFLPRLATGLVLLALPAAVLLLVDQGTFGSQENRYNAELSHNGVYSLVRAFRNNIIDYGEFYPTRDDGEVFDRLRQLLAADNAKFLLRDRHDVARDVTAEGPEKRHNVVIVTIESFSAEYVGSLGAETDLTPRFSALTKQGVLFTNFYATGTRTDRGLEAITLSLPPTPGRSMVKRPDNENLFSLGFLFRGRGYDTKFIYGGFGYFDNMNSFYEHNGFSTLDRRQLSESEITFSNIWGVCDEDLYRRTLKECDASFAAGRPFFFQLMTTSNHRPFTYPAGRIAAPQGHRPGAVTYTDFALGDFLDKARGKPWFDNTVFLIVADHCASSAGKTEVPFDRYHIPLLIYAPAILPPRAVDRLASQIDIAPTLLGLMNFSYRSKFFGRDVLREAPPGIAGRALLGNYQKISLATGDRQLILMPTRRWEAMSTGGVPLAKDDPAVPSLLTDTITYYQSAAYLLGNRLYGWEE